MHQNAIPEVLSQKDDASGNGVPEPFLAALPLEK
jgi:hypothetical protein